MNSSTAGLLSKVLMAACLVAFAATAAAQVYKTVDENGNVIYTDQPPDPDAKPVELPGLSVIESVKAPEPVESEDAAPGEEAVTDIRELRRGYRDFQITKPAQDEYVEGTGNMVTIAWDTRYALQPGMAVIISLDGTQLEPTVSSAITVQQVDRGEHTVSARLVDSQLRVIADAAPVTFYVRQFSQNFGGPARPAPARR